MRPFDAIIATPCQAMKLGIRTSSDGVVSIMFLPPATDTLAPIDKFPITVTEQIRAYFENPHSPISVAIAIRGSAFQQRVWRAIRAIPPGSTCQYGQLASQLLSSARAVGHACRVNPVPLITPCHRIVAANGLGGFCGQTAHSQQRDKLAVKHWLLQHEHTLSH